MRYLFTPSKPRKSVSPPPSKSLSHRYLIGGLLARGESQISGISRCDDVTLTRQAVVFLGGDLKEENGILHLSGGESKETYLEIPCGLSASTLRMLLPVVCLKKRRVRFLCEEVLIHRPHEILAHFCEDNNIYFKAEERYIEVQGQLSCGEFHFFDNSTTQLYSGLLMALPTLSGDSILHLRKLVESSAYIEMTMGVLADFGVLVEWIDDATLRIPGGQTYTPICANIPPDQTAAAALDAFFFVSEKTTPNATVHSVQGDAVYPTFFRQLDSPNARISLAQNPDLAPTLFAMASLLFGGTFVDIKRLKGKESDRVGAMVQELEKVGANIEVKDDMVTIFPAPLHTPEIPRSAHGDHRIAMACALVLSVLGGVLDGGEAVKKSYGAFFDDIQNMGIHCVTN